MKEKYLHSKAASLNNEGRSTEALRLIEDALRLREESYLYSDLSRLFKNLGKIDEALNQISRAIELEPKNPAYYYERACILRKKGDAGLASLDFEKAAGIDVNYRRIESIHHALGMIEDILAAEERLETFCKKRRLTVPLADALTPFIKRFVKLRETLEGTSCPVRTCLPYCCYFSDELVRHGVVMGPWKLQEVRKQLSAHGLDEHDFIAEMPFRGEHHLKQLFPPSYIISTKGSQRVHYPARSDRTLGEGDLVDRPLGRGYSDLHWIAEGSRACVFLKNRRCSIYETGDDEALEACRHFLCFTGFVSVIAIQLGTIDETVLGRIPLEKLNRSAVEILLSLADHIFNAGTVRYILDAEKCAKKAGWRRGSDDKEKLEACGIFLKDLRGEYDEAFTEGIGRVKKAIVTLLTEE